MKIQNVTFVKGAASWKDLPRDGKPEAAFIGRSNVGKSSLINMVTGRRTLARISNTPGKTREFNFYLVNDNFYLVDLPGFGYARTARKERERWARFIGRYFTQREEVAVTFHLIDSRHPPGRLDREIMSLQQGNLVPYVVLLTKADKLSGNERVKSEMQVRKALAEFGLDVPVVLTSAKTRRGIQDVHNLMDVFLA